MKALMLRMLESLVLQIFNLWLSSWPGLRNWFGQQETDIGHVSVKTIHRWTSLQKFLYSNEFVYLNISFQITQHNKKITRTLIT